MRSPASAVLFRTASMVAAIFTAFALFQAPARSAEARAVVWLFRTLGSDRIGTAGATSLYVVPWDKPSFLAVLTPSCSSLASVLAMIGLVLLAPVGTRRRRIVALSLAVLAIGVGNMLRMAGSLAIGLVAGRSSLVLFHDSIGNVFSFAYTLGGYILLLYLLLPATAAATAPRTPTGARWSREPKKEGDRVPVGG